MTLASSDIVAPVGHIHADRQLLLVSSRDDPGMVAGMREWSSASVSSLAIITYCLQ